MAEKIIVIDDEPLILKAVEKALTKEGYTFVKPFRTGDLRKKVRDIFDELPCV